MKFYFSKFYNFTKSGWITVEILGGKKKKKANLLSQVPNLHSKIQRQNSSFKKRLPKMFFEALHFP